eukprot:5231059-Pyramimonas_sp.AAC.1
MPGPDGIPYFCWRLGDAPRFLFDLYRDFVSGQVSALPRDMLEVLMVFFCRRGARETMWGLVSLGLRKTHVHFPWPTLMPRY